MKNKEELYELAKIAGDFLKEENKKAEAKLEKKRGKRGRPRRTDGFIFRRYAGKDFNGFRLFIDDVKQPFAIHRSKGVGWVYIGEDADYRSLDSNLAFDILETSYEAKVYALSLLDKLEEIPQRDLEYMQKSLAKRKTVSGRRSYSRNPRVNLAIGKYVKMGMLDLEPYPQGYIADYNSVNLK